MRDTRPAGGPLRDAFDLAAAVLPERTTDRPLDGDLAAAATVLADLMGPLGLTA
jgi:histidine ammonia-lyase